MSTTLGIVFIVVGFLLIILQSIFHIRISRGKFGGIIAGPVLIILGILILAGVIQ